MTASNGYRPSEAVARVLARDSLLLLAADADKAVGIVRQREELTRLSKDEKSLFSVALQEHLRLAEGKDTEWSVRAGAWRHAGVIVQFCELIGIAVELPEGVHYTSAQMHERSLRMLRDEVNDRRALAKDPNQYAFHLSRGARNLRLLKRFKEAAEMASLAQDALNASGAAPQNGYLLFELGAAYIGLGRAGQIERRLREWDRYWSEGLAAAFPTRYRFDFIRGLGRWESSTAGAENELETALSRVRGEASAGAVDPEHSVEELSVTLAMAEFWALHGTSEHHAEEALRLGRRALKLADQVRGRWRVIARSRAPLAVVFQRVFGDIALLADRLNGAAAAELGLRVALSAKQTGFAARLRSGRTLLSSTVEGIIDDIIALEEKQADQAEPGGPVPQGGKTLDELRFELQEAVSPLLADTVVPPPSDLSTLIDMIDARHALDYVEFTDSLGRNALFATLIHPGGRVTFQRIDVDPYYQDFFRRARDHGGLSDRLRHALPPADPAGAGGTAEAAGAGGTAEAAGAGRDLPPEGRSGDPAGDEKPGIFDWHTLARNVLPDELLAELTTAEAPLMRLLISAHSWLSLVPWPSLVIEKRDDGSVTRLVERAVITQTPVFTCLHYEQPPVVRGNALIRLVGLDEGGVDVADERKAWGLPVVSAGQPLSGCAIHADDVPAVHGRSLAEELRDQSEWDFLHIAAHGTGRGMEQELRIGHHQTLSFGQALTLRWPTSVLMASCHVGQVINVTEAEPLNFVMAMLSGRARCVVAGIAAVGDAGTGRVARAIVERVRAGHISLDAALREAQLAEAARDEPAWEWALLAAYTQ
jgi:hypothetical protein